MHAPKLRPSFRLRRCALSALLVAALSLASACTETEAVCNPGDPLCAPLLAPLLYQQVYVSAGANFLGGSIGTPATLECAIYESNGPTQGFRTVARISNCATIAGLARGADGLYAAAGGSALSEDSGECRLYTSYDRRAWTPQPCTSNFSFNRILYAGSRGFYAADFNGAINASVDGQTWRSFTPPSLTDKFRSFYYSRALDRFFVGDTDSLLSSPDVETTALAPVSGAPAFDYRALGEMQNGRLIALHGASDGSNVGAVYSDDGLNWSVASNLLANRTRPTNADSLAHAPNYSVASGGSGNTPDCMIDWTEDGATWNGGYTLFSPGLICLSDVSYADGQFWISILGVNAAGEAVIRSGFSSDPRGGPSAWTLTETRSVFGAVSSAAEFGVH